MPDTNKKEDVAQFDQELFNRIKVGAGNRAVNMYFNTLLSFLTTLMYRSTGEKGRAETDTFLAQLKIDTVSNTHALVSNQESLPEELRDELKVVLENNLNGLVSPLEQFIENFKAQAKQEEEEKD
jgi:hypothetical protein